MRSSLSLDSKSGTYLSLIFLRFDFSFKIRNEFRLKILLPDSSIMKRTIIKLTILFLELDFSRLWYHSSLPNGFLPSHLVGWHPYLPPPANTNQPTFSLLTSLLTQNDDKTNLPLPY